MTNWLGRLRLPRFVLMIGGEAMQSGLHFVLNLVLIGLLPQREYGLFAFTMVIGGVGLTYVRGLTAMPAKPASHFLRWKARLQHIEPHGLRHRCRPR